MGEGQAKCKEVGPQNFTKALDHISIAQKYSYIFVVLENEAENTFGEKKMLDTYSKRQYFKEHFEKNKSIS